MSYLWEASKQLLTLSKASKYACGYVLLQLNTYVVPVNYREEPVANYYPSIGIYLWFINKFCLW